MDILSGLLRLVELIKAKTPAVVNMFPRCVTREGNLAAQEQLWRVFRATGGRWRGIAHVPNGNLRLREEFALIDARKRFTIDLPSLWDYAPPGLARQCICGDIMAGIKNPRDCRLFNKVRARERSAPAWCRTKGLARSGILRRRARSRGGFRMSAIMEQRITLKQGGGGRAMRAHREAVCADFAALPKASASARWMTARRSDR
jgi:hypothetical protein